MNMTLTVTANMLYIKYAGLLAAAQRTNMVDLRTLGSALSISQAISSLIINEKYNKGFCNDQ